MNRLIPRSLALTALLTSSLAMAQAVQEAQAVVASAASISFWDGSTASSSITTTWSSSLGVGPNVTPAFTIQVKSTSGYTISASTDKATMTEWDAAASPAAYTTRALATPLSVTISSTTTSIGVATGTVYTGSAATGTDNLTSSLNQQVTYGDSVLPAGNYYKAVITYTVTASGA